MAKDQKTSGPESRGPSREQTQSLYHRQPTLLGDPNGSGPTLGPSARFSQHTSHTRSQFGKTLAILALLLAVFGGFVLLAKIMLDYNWKTKLQKTQGEPSAPALAAPVSRAIPDVLSPPIPAEPPAYTNRYRVADESVRNYESLFLTSPDTSGLWFRAGRVFLNNSNYPAARVAFEIACAEKPETPDLLLLLGRVGYYQRRYVQAATLFRESLARDPSLVEAIYFLALCHVENRDYSSAWTLLHQYLLARPDNIDALKLKAMLETLSNRFEEALSTLEKAIALAPEEPGLYIEAAAIAAHRKNNGLTLLYLRKTIGRVSPNAVYRILQSPAFQDFQVSEDGLSFQRELAAAARDQLSAAQQSPGTNR